MTVGEALNRWFEHARANLSPSTASVSRMIIDKHLVPHIGKLPLSKLTPAAVDAAYRALGAKGGRGAKPLAAATVRRAHNVLHRTMAQAVRWGWLPTNPVSLASPPRLPPSEINPPAPSVVQALVAEAERTGPSLATYVQLAAATGARRGELVALRWSHVDLDGGVVRITRGIVHGLDGLIEKDTKSHAGRRIAIDVGTVAALRRHRLRADEVASACGVALDDTCFVFASSVDAKKSWNPAYLPRPSPASPPGPVFPTYACTTYVISWPPACKASGVDVRTVAGRLGHADNPNVTLNVYAHFLPEADRDAADLIGRLLAVSPEAG